MTYFSFSAKTFADRLPLMPTERALNALSDYCADFESAVLLLNVAPNFADQNRAISSQIHRWGKIAARDAGMTIYHFGKCFEGIRRSLNETPPLKGKIEHHVLRQIWKDFMGRFPMYEEIRHAIAHDGEMKTANQIQKHAFMGEFKTPAVNITGGALSMKVLIDSTYTMNFEGKTITYSIDQETLSHLLDFKNRILRCFSDANDALNAE